jgi:hypothetical protein
MNKKTSNSPAQGWITLCFLMMALLASSLAAYAQESVPPNPVSRIRGTIRTCAGVPVPGVTVNIEGDFGGDTVVTDASGVYGTTLELGSYTVTPVPPVGYFFTPQQIVVFGSNLSANFTRYPRDNRANFDGDCKTDVSVFNRTTGDWTSRNSSDGVTVIHHHGTTGDIATPGDYNADGKTDYAVFRPSEGNWYIATDRSGNYSTIALGQNGDIPVARDYDGDAKTDLAVFRPSTGAWIIRTSSNNTVQPAVFFGQAGDRVVPGDYDGDNKADIAVFRPSDALWYILPSNGGSFYAVSFGLGTDIPVQADYNGDGVTDFAVFRPGDVHWYIRRPDGTFYGIPFGFNSDRLVPGDYDGDGLADIAVQRPVTSTTAIWHLLNSSTGYTSVEFSPEFPVPAAYLTPLY